MAKILIPRSDVSTPKLVAPSDWEEYFADIVNDYVRSGLTISAGTGLAVNIASGKARVKGLFVNNTTSTSHSGLTANTVNYVYITVSRDVSNEPSSWDFASNTTGVTPTDSLLIGAATTDGSSVTSVNMADVVTESGVSSKNSFYFGDGSDGNVTISSNTTITTGKQYNDLTVNSGVTLDCTATKILTIRCKGTLTINGTISMAGQGGSGGSAGSAGAGGGAFPPASGGNGSGGGSGGNGGSGYYYGSSGSSGSNGGTGAAGAVGGSTGGAGGSGGTSSITYTQPIAATSLPLETMLAFIPQSYGAGGGGGGGGGGQGSTNNNGNWQAGGNGGAGGAGGAGGGSIFILAKKIIINGSGVITVAGLGGTNGTSGSYGGGSGGNGGSGGSGSVFTVYRLFTNNGTITGNHFQHMIT